MSTIKVNNLQTTDGVEVYTSKLWVNWNGTGTVAVRASGNVSSITDLAVGHFMVNPLNAIIDANYAVSMDCRNDIGVNADVAFNLKWETSPATTYYEVCSARYGNSGNQDSVFMFSSITR